MIDKEVKKQKYERLAIFEIKEVLPYIVYGSPSKLRKRKRKFLGQMVKMCSWRYQTFAIHGTKCYKCGLEGSFFALDKTFGPY